MLRRPSVSSIGPRPRVVARWALTSILLVGLLAPARAEDAAVVEQRLKAAAEFIASEELEGRGLLTQGINLAADYIAAQFRDIGLKTELIDGQPFQKFTVATGAELGENNRLAFQHEDGTRIELQLDKNYTPLAIGGAGSIEAPMAFVGYAITAQEEIDFAGQKLTLDYDDFAGLDVKGKLVVMIRKEPEQGNPHSLFNGNAASRHATFNRKISNAYQHGAVAVVIVNDLYSLDEQAASIRKQWKETIDQLRAALDKPQDEKPAAKDDAAKDDAAKDDAAKDAAADQKADPTVKQLQNQANEIARLSEKLKELAPKLGPVEEELIGFDAAGFEGGRDIPVFNVSRAAIDPLIQAALGKDLAQLEKDIDSDLKPRSAELAGWRAVGHADVQRTRTEVKNVIAVLEGEGPLADETVVVGAHYDHLGYGEPGSIGNFGKAIRHGADDNGSGTVVLLEVARQLAAQGKPKRRIVFMAFSGEERGLLGSAHYAENPLFEMSNTVFMLNLDMVGRLNEERKLIIQGLDTSKGFGDLIDELNATYNFKIERMKGGSGPSDHTSFYQKKVPVMHFFTGTHKDYHRPSDTADRLNIAGMREIAGLTLDVVRAIASADERPEYIAVAAPRRQAGAGGDRPYFGSIPSFEESDGFKLSGVTEGGPADKGGLKAGDVILQLNDFKIGNLEDFDGALRKFKAGDKIKVLIQRGENKEQKTLEVTVEAPR